MLLISLVLATYGRTNEIIRFLDCLKHQKFRSFELIVIDQNPDNRLSPIISLYLEEFSIKHLRSEMGVSRARNLGLRNADGEVITFPDDDCWYLDNLLEEVVRRFNKHPEIDGFTGRTLDEEGGSLARFSSQASNLTKINTWYRVSACSTFLRKEVIAQVGGFDETLGPGSGTLWGSAEDVDYPLRAIDKGYRLFFDPYIVVYHADPKKDGYENLSRKAFNYGAGIGRVWRKHDFPTWYIGYHFLRPIGGIISSALIGNFAKAKYHWLSLQGRYSGWRSKL